MEWRFEYYGTDATWPAPSGEGLLLGVGTTVCCVEQHSGLPRWELPLEADVSARPAVGRDTGFVVDASGRLHAFDVSTGDHRWSRAIDANDAVPAVTGGDSIIATTGEGVVSLDADTGECDWKRRLPSGPSGLPALTTESVCAGTEDGIVYALSRTDGTVRWQAVVEEPCTRAGVAVDDETLYVPTAPLHSEASGAVHALDTTTGENRWTAETPTTTKSALYQVTPPLVDDGTVYLVSGCERTRENRIQVIRNGRTVWSAEVSGGPHASPPAITDGTVLTYSAGSLLAFDRESGEERWSARVRDTPRPKDETMPYGSPVVTGRSIVVRGPRKLFAVSIGDGRHGADPDCSGDASGQSTSGTNGAVPDRPPTERAHAGTSPVRYPSTTSRLSGDATVRWGFHSTEGTLINPMLVDDTVYLASSRGIATALDPEDGTVRWLTELDGQFEKCPLVANGTLLLVGSDCVFALDPQDGSVHSRTATLPDDPEGPTGDVATPAENGVSFGYTSDLEKIIVTVTTEDGGEWQFEDELPGYATVWDSYYGQIGSLLFMGLMFKPGASVFYALDAETESVRCRLVGKPGGGVDVFSPPILHEGRLFVTCSDHFYAVDLFE